MEGIHHLNRGSQDSNPENIFQSHHFFGGEVITLPETDSSVSHLKMDGCLEY